MAIVVPLLAVAGGAFAYVKQIPAGTAAPIVAAILAQGALYLAAGFPAVRERLRQALPPARFAAALAGASLLPYLLYALPLGTFAWSSLAILAAIAVFASFLFVVFPVDDQKLHWQDVLLIAVLASPLVSGLTDLFQQIFPAPGDPIKRLDFLGKLMVIPLGAFAMLCLRGVDDVDFRFSLGRRDLAIGLRWFLLSLPFTLVTAWATGFAHWQPDRFASWQAYAGIFAKGIGIYLVTALAEELCFRGVLQNLLGGTLRSDAPARVVAALAFGAVHLGNGGFPNWGFAITATVAGWFYGGAWREARGVPAAAVTHTLTVLVWTFLFD
ncbi:MAG: CPBP family intramembrane metalloprotease [Bryobacterales bacterium]|nr:CPBP family intramembrane metalloprotease [Acidobacteriota bacterium]MCB9383419.1 CPBP family intramembrane metalloprotease [Bryobacterales bacterium]